MAFSTQKRFIAGVTCPKCGQMDKLQAYSLDGVDYRECVSCGFRDEMRVFSEPRELETRVNDLPENKVSTVKLVDPS
ncbi:MAG: YheV family putative zinc ribbon protein [Porticoccaceae bacterium]